MKKLLSVILALVMLVSVISVPAFAEGEELSVVYIANGEPLAKRTAADGVALGETFAVDFRAPNTNEKYFTGWYKNAECTGAPVESITVADGVNHLYAGYKDYQTVITPTYYDTTKPWYTIPGPHMYFPLIDKNGIYYATYFTSNTSYANMVLAEEEDGGTYWLRSGDTGNMVFPLVDEQGYAYQFRAGSTYKYTMKVKNVAGDGGVIEMALGKLPSATNGKGGWTGTSHQAAKAATLVNTSSQVDLYANWQEVSGYISATDLAEDAYEFLAIRTSKVSASDQIGIKDFTVEELSVEYYVDDTPVYKTVGHAANEVVTPDCELDVPEGKVFQGWYTDAELTQAATTVTVTGAMKLYAKFGVPPKAIYYANGVEIETLTENLTVGGTYTTKNINLNDAEYADYIPAGYYFTGWYTDEACTVPVKVANLIEKVTVTGDIVRYAGLSEYEKEFSPWAFNDTNRPSTVERLGANYSVLQYPMVHAVDENTSVFTNYIPSNGGNWSVNMTTQGEDTIYSYSIDEIGVFVFHDENGKVFKAKPGASYEITYEYMFTSPDAKHSIFPNIGYPVSYITTDTTAWRSVQGYRLSGSNVASIGSSKGPAMDVTATSGWTEYKATLVTPDNAAYEPFFYIRNNYGDLSTTGSSLQIKNIKVKMVTAKVNLYVDGEFDKTVEINPGKFIPEVTPEAPEGKYFTGWYTDADCTVAMPAEGIDAVAGETKDLYAGFETYKTVKYYVGDEVVNTVGNLKVGDTHVVDYEPDAIEGMTFVGWYTEEAFENVATSIAITGDVKLYAKFVEPFGLTYVYKNADGSEAKKSVEGVQVGDTYSIDFLAPNTNTQYFVGWYLDSNYATEATAKVTLENDEAYKLYAKYVDYSNVMNLHVPGDGDDTTKVYMPIILPAANATSGYEYRVGYHRWVASSAHSQLAAFDAETGVTAISMNAYQSDAAHILVDENDQFVAAKPGKTYKLTAEVRSSRGNAKICFGVGATRDKFQVYYNDNQWRRKDNANNGTHELIVTSPATNVSAKEEFETYSAVVTVPADYSDENYNFFALKIIEGGANEFVYVRSVTIEEYELPNTTGEYSGQIGGVVYEAGEVEDGETYAVTFNYTGAAANLGFFTADKDGATYANVSKVEGGKTVIAVNGDDTYTAYITVDKAKGQGATLYAYAIDVQTAGEVSDVTVTPLANAITNGGAAVLTPETEKAAGSQAIRYYFGYETDNGTTIKINGNTFEVVKRGFLFANGTDENGEERYDDNVYVDTTKVKVVNRFVAGAALANCWDAANGRIRFSTHVTGFGEDNADNRSLFVKAYVTFKDNDGNEFTIYSEATNGTVAQIKARLGQLV